MLPQRCSLAKFCEYTVSTQKRLLNFFSFTSVPPLFCGACTNAMPLTAVGLAQSAGHLTAEQEVKG